MREVDVIIVGGGPAGAVCAAELIQEGYSLLLLDKENFPRDKLCAGWVPPGLFTRIGIDPSEYPHGIREFRRLHIRLKGFPFPVPTRQYAIRRYEFDAWLLERSGAEVRQHRVRRIEKTEGSRGRYLVDGKYSCRYLVGAAGTACPVAAALRRGKIKEHGAEQKESNLIVTMEEEFPYPVENNNCYLRFFDHGLLGYSWYFPKDDGYLTVGIGGRMDKLRERGESIRDHWRLFTEHLEQKGLVREHPYSPSGHSYYLRGSDTLLGNGEGVFLVGDAAHLATTDMGEGIEPAVHSGQLAARAIVENRTYSVEHVKRRSLPEILRIKRNKP